MDTLIWIGKGVLWLAAGIAVLYLVLGLYFFIGYKWEYDVMPWLIRRGWMEPPYREGQVYNYGKGEYRSVRGRVPAPDPEPAVDRP